jgi:hypothetical protein
MDRPRLIHYNDAHHFHAKRIEPPASHHLLNWPVDEVLGTGVDLLVLGLGYGDVYFHQSKVGRVVGQDKEVWESYIDWRIMRMVEVAQELGTDQLRAVIERGRDTGLRVFPSLKLQDSAQPGSERSGRLKEERGAAVCIGDEGRAEWCYDYAHEAVQEDKLAMVAEVLDDYGADGLELDFCFDNFYFKQREIVKNIPRMNEFVGKVRALAEEIGARQGRKIPLLARVHLKEADNLAVGLDVAAWLAAGSLDWVVGQDGNVLVDPGIQAPWLAGTAEAAGGAAYYRPPRRIYDERVGLPSIEMYRALGQTLAWQGYAGMYLGYMPWPFAEREYQILREVAYPQAHARSDKRYLLQPREGALDAETTTPERQVPEPLVEGETAAFDIWVAEEVESALADGEMRDAILTLRFAFFCIEDEIEMRFNGRVLSRDEAEISDERALAIPVALAGSMALQAPLGFSAHWFRFRLAPAEIKRGANRVEIEVKKLDGRAGFARSVNGAEILVRYRDFARPEGLTLERVAPPGG